MTRPESVQAGLAWLFTTEVNFTPLQSLSSVSVQEFYVRAMGRVDETIRLQLQWNLDCAGVEGVENHQCCEESEGVGRAGVSWTSSWTVRRAKLSERNFFGQGSRCLYR